MNDGQVALLKERLKRSHGGMEAEEAIEVEDLLLGDGDGGAHGVVVGFAVGDDDVEAVGCSALEDDDEALALRFGGLGLGEDGAGEEGGQDGGAGEGECSVTEEEAPGKVGGKVRLEVSRIEHASYS